MIDVLVPTYGRPDALQRLYDNVVATARSCEPTVTFVVEKNDKASLEAARKVAAAVVLVNPDEPSYSNALQWGYENTWQPFFITGNDDFDFQDDWDSVPLKMMEANPGVDVVGLDDGDPRTKFSTISFVRRTYIELDSGCIGIPNRVFYPYRHNYADTEFFHTAVARGVWASAPASRVFHLHPDFGRGADDDTYKRGRKSLADDRETFRQRQILWLA